MTKQQLLNVCVGLAVLCLLGGCRGGGATWPAMGHNAWDEMERNHAALDRKAILKMAGTFDVTFSFEEVLPLQEGYELDEPYETSAQELVIVVENQERYISLQHLLVVRHGEETHVINHWRQDWIYHPDQTFHYLGDGIYRIGNGLRSQGMWTQLVYNVADSPRYSAIGRWQHVHGLSIWTSNNWVQRPLPLREAAKREDYNLLRGRHRLTVSDGGWVHIQDNLKQDDQPNQPDKSIAMEHGLNRYLRVPDEGFEKAHDYWGNTEAYWKVVRSVWAEVFDDADRFKLRKKWKGDPLFSHLFGLADEYWGQADVSEARPRIEEIIDAFVVEE